MTNYATVYELKMAINPDFTADWSPGETELLEIAIGAASRWIDSETGTHFYPLENETRYYTAEYPDLLDIDDLLELDSLKTSTSGNGIFDRTWTSDRYRLLPFNAAVKGQPYRRIMATYWSLWFPLWPGAVEVTGTFGYSEEPPASIKQACLLIAHRLFKRRESIFGIGSLPAAGAGVTIVQAQIQKDADIMLLLSSVKSKVIV